MNDPDQLPEVGREPYQISCFDCSAETAFHPRDGFQRLEEIKG